MTHLPSLDWLRALAVLLVVFFHSPAPMFEFPMGWIGVNLFFTLSAFLITRILLNIKRTSPGNYFRIFYLRRILRIFPLYYLYLIIATITLLIVSDAALIGNEGFAQGWNDLTNHWPYLITFTYNFEEIAGFLFHGDYLNSRFFGHLWTLSVEEQFYLVFPVVVYLVPVKWLTKILVAVVLLTPFFRLATAVCLQQAVDIFWLGDILYISTVFQLDALALGALLALSRFEGLSKFAGWALIACLTIFGVVGVMNIYVGNLAGIDLWSSFGFDNPIFHLANGSGWIRHRYFYSIPVINLTFAALLFWLLQVDLSKSVFLNKVAGRIARISYCVYLIHLCVSFLIEWSFGKMFEVTGPGAQLITQIIYLASLFIMGELSYRYFERKFLDLNPSFTTLNTIT